MLPVNDIMAQKKNHKIYNIRRQSMFKIVTDSTADLPAEYLKEHDLGCINLSYIMDGVTYGQGQELPEKEFYALMRNGKMPTTSQVNPEEAKNHFLKYLKENKEILCIAFSSGLSGTYNSMRVAAEEIMEEQPDCRIIVIDSLCASLGEGLLVHKAVTLRDQGKSLEEVAEWVKNNRLHLVHVFTVDDLYHLYRGGRVSRATAVVGTLAGIKPKLHVDDEGHLIVIGKVRGRKNPCMHWWIIWKRKWALTVIRMILCSSATGMIFRRRTGKRPGEGAVRNRQLPDQLCRTYHWIPFRSRNTGAVFHGRGTVN